MPAPRRSPVAASVAGATGRHDVHHRCRRAGLAGPGPPRGWSVTDTEGDAPVVSVRRDGIPVGIVGFLHFPVEAAGPDDRATLDAHVAHDHRDIGAGRLVRASGLPEAAPAPAP